MVTVEQLTALAQSMRITTQGPSTLGPGQQLRAGLTPDVSDLSLTDVLTGNLDVTWITKDVRFDTYTREAGFTPDSPSTTILGPVPLPSTLGGSLPGTPGLLGQLVGKIPVSGAAEVPVTVTVAWTVHADDDARTPLTSGTDFVAPGGLNVPAPVLAFAPQVVELTTTMGAPAPTRRWLRATVTLSAAGVTTLPQQLPEVPVLVAPLPIPTILALFLHTEFAAHHNDDEGAVLLVVPGNSPLASVRQVTDTLSSLQTAVSTLAGLGTFGLFLPAISELSNAITAQPHVHLRAADAINNLNDITLIQRGFFENDTEAEDELSSLILIGARSKRVECNNDRDQKAGQGRFTLAPGSSFHVMVRSLHSANPAATPGGETPPVLTVNTAPPGGWFDPDDFGDDLSSVRFTA